MTSGLLLLALLGGAIASLYFLTSKLACLSLLSFGLYFYLDATLPPVPASAHVSRGVDAEAPLQAAEPEKRVVVEEKPPRPARPFWVKNNRPFWQERNLYQPDWDWRAAHSQRRVVLPEEVHAVAPASPPARKDDKPASESGSRGQSPPPVVASVLAEISMPPTSTADVRTEVPQREVLRPCSRQAIRACEQTALGVPRPIRVSKTRAKKPVRRTLFAKKVHFDAGVEGAPASLHLQPLHQAVEGAAALVGPVLYQQNAVEEIEEMAGVESTTTILNTVAEQLPPTTFQAVDAPVQEQSEEMVGLEATAAPVFPGLMFGQQTSEAAPEEVFVCGSTTPTTYTQEVTPVYEPASAPSPSPAPPAAVSTTISTTTVEQAETTTPAPEADADLDSELLGLTADADDDDEDADGESVSSVSSSIAGAVADAKAKAAAAALLAATAGPEAEADTTADAASSPPAADAEPEADTATDSATSSPAADDAASRAKVAEIRNNIDSTYTNMKHIFKERCNNLEKKPTTAHYRAVWANLNKIEDVEMLPGTCISNMRDVVTFIEEEPEQFKDLMAEPEAEGNYGNTVFEQMWHLTRLSRTIYGKGRFEGPKHPVEWLPELSRRCYFVVKYLQEDYASEGWEE